VRFSVDHRFAAALTEVERAMTDAEFFAELRDLPGVEAPVLLDRRERPGTVELDVRYVFSGELPSVARRVLGGGRPAWVQRSVVDLERHRTAFTIVPDVHAELLSCSGIYVLRAVPSAQRGEQTTRTISGELRVFVPLLAARAERAIVNGLVERIGAEADALRRWLAARPAG
jgi:hypothetical protein